MGWDPTLLLSSRKGSFDLGPYEAIIKTGRWSPIAKSEDDPRDISPASALAFQPLELGNDTFLRQKLSRLWYSIAAAPGNQC